MFSKMVIFCVCYRSKITNIHERIIFSCPLKNHVFFNTSYNYNLVLNLVQDVYKIVLNLLQSVY